MRGRAALALALLLAAGAALAQQVDVAAPPAARCITGTTGEEIPPVYPFDEFKRNERGAVQVLLEFSAPDREPRVTVMERTSEPFADAVRAQARTLRVPCMEASSAPVRLIRDYVFRPDDRKVHWHRPVDADAADNRRAWECVKHLRGHEHPTYPRGLLESGVQGRVVAEVRFDGPDREPVAQVHARPYARHLAAAVRDWLSETRMPCHPGRPVTAYVTFIFQIEGDPAFGFKNVPFRSLLASTAGIERQTLAFDTTTMGCPFDVRLWFRRPYLPNQVGEVGDRDPARRPLLEWLETVELKLPRGSLDSIYGDSTLVTVPCARIDLKPKE